MRKGALIIITLLLVGGIITALYFFTKESKYFGTSPLKAVPTEVPYFFRVRNIGEFAVKMKENKGWQQLKEVKQLSGLFESFGMIDSLYLGIREKENILQNKELIAVPTAKSWLLIVGLGSITEKKSIQAMISQYFSSRNISSVELDLKVSVAYCYDWSNKGEKRNLIYTIHKGLFLAGTEQSDLKQAIARLETSSLLEDPFYQRVSNNSARNIDLNIYLNHKTLPSQFTFTRNDSLSKGIFGKTYAAWTELDLIQKENRLLLNGYTVSDSLGSNYLNLFGTQLPLAGKSTAMLPANATFFSCTRFSDKAGYFDVLENSYRNSGAYDTYRNRLTSLSTTLKVDVAQWLKEKWTGEAVIFYTNFNLESAADNRYLLLFFQPDLADPLVNAIKKWAAEKKETSKVTVPESDNTSILLSPEENFGYLLGEIYGNDIKTKYLTIGNGFMVMGPTQGSLKRYLQQMELGERLEMKPAYAGFADGQDSLFNFQVWNTTASLPFFEQSMKASPYHSLQTSEKILSRLEYMAWQGSMEKGQLFNAAAVALCKDSIPSAQPFWRYPLAARISGRAVFVSFSAQDPRKNLVFQDEDNYLIALDKDGRQCWKLKLDGKIIGNIQTLDPFKNGEYRLFFNTRDAIHQVNARGQEEKSFPIKLKSPAVSEVTVYDHTGKKDYRYLVACKDKRIYYLDKTGKSIPGWSIKSAGKAITSAVYHLGKNQKECLVYTDEEKLHIIDKVGKERLKPGQNFVPSHNGLFPVTDSGREELVTTDEEGRIIRIGTDKTERIVDSGGYTSNHLFLPWQIGNGRGTGWALFDLNRLTGYEPKGEQRFSFTLTAKENREMRLYANEGYLEISSLPDGNTTFVRKDGSVFAPLLPSGYRLLTAGRFYAQSKVLNLVAVAKDGSLVNFQMWME